MRTSIEKDSTVGIVCATGIEARFIRDCVGRSPIVVTGMGQANARAGVSRLLGGFSSIRAVVNLGIAGSLKPDQFPKGSLVVAGSVGERDVDDPRFLDCSTSGLSQLSNMCVATVLTGDGVVTSPSAESLERMRSQGDVVDMEAFAIVEECRRLGVPVCVVKAVSDIVGKKSAMDLLKLPVDIGCAMVNLRAAVGDILLSVGRV